MCLLLTMPTRHLLFIICLLCSSLGGHSQKTSEDDYASGTEKKSSTAAKTRWQDNLVFGGNLGGSFGNPSYFQLNPMVGYRTTPWWINGIGLNYTYFSTNAYRENIYGASIWTRATVFKTLFAHSEFEILKRSAFDGFGNTAEATVPVWLVGAGYNSGGSRLGLSAMIMYDLIQDPNSPYNQPMIRIGGLFGF
jgi:hypothetical protein